MPRAVAQVESEHSGAELTSGLVSAACAVVGEHHHTWRKNHQWCDAANPMGRYWQNWRAKAHCQQAQQRSCVSANTMVCHSCQRR